MDLIANLALGLQSALSFTHLLYCLAGVSIGTLIGVLPGMGPVATVAINGALNAGLLAANWPT